MTVKELRQLVKETVEKRGVLSKLKKKQDLIEFLENKRGAAPELITNGVQLDKAPRHHPLGMPPPTPDPNGLGTVQIAETQHPPLGMPAATVENNDGVADSHVSEAPATRSPRELAFEQVYERYPPIRGNPSQNYSVPADDPRQLYHPFFAETNNTSSDMDIVFVGTASCTPSITRGVSCTALRLNWRRSAAVWNAESKSTQQVGGFQGGTWLFDAGECTQLQIQRSPSIKPSKITKVFLTHAHGDHSFGLPGLLCLMGQDRDRDSPPVEIYGPEGLRMWLRVAIRYSVSRIVPPYRVHEIMDVPMAPEWEAAPRARRFFYRGRPRNGQGQWGSKGLAGEDPISWISQANLFPLEPSPLYGEIEGGRDIYPIYDHPLSSDGAPVWEVEDEEDVKVYAAPMSHGIPCVGYVVHEQPRPGRLRNELVEPIVRRNVDALREAGFKIPMKAMAVIKNMSPGSSFKFPDGTVLSQEEAVEPERKGRKVVICGDTCDSRALSKLAMEADIVVHEATNCFIQGVDRDTDARSVTKDAIIHGHSTPQIAGRFAQQVGASRLILNHFSARYKGDLSVDSLSIMMRIEKVAVKASGFNESNVVASWDLMTVPIPPK
eukprot:CAMPEP_0168754586 /NCGR_PEP_ID=MMETSP0724-20121128/19583_1 /TAXON_ID=265536 /ORGANISM="Amphiprora sp., Strain CCMP467" /LENGTH=605 /DNA_ID=CAMNT_0008803081 /DNA_START=295 /DNA_END=2115 /DNA_ORIENTATION=+